MTGLRGSATTLATPVLLTMRPTTLVLPTLLVTALAA
jgi:hypothetical protein